jgi:hypothetical protein
MRTLSKRSFIRRFEKAIKINEFIDWRKRLSSALSASQSKLETFSLPVPRKEAKQERMKIDMFKAG